MQPVATCLSSEALHRIQPPLLNRRLPPCTQQAVVLPRLSPQWLPLPWSSPGSCLTHWGLWPPTHHCQLRPLQPQAAVHTSPPLSPPVHSAVCTPHTITGPSPSPQTWEEAVSPRPQRTQPSSPRVFTTELARLVSSLVASLDHTLPEGWGTPPLAECLAHSAWTYCRMKDKSRSLIPWTERNQRKPDPRVGAAPGAKVGHPTKGKPQPSGHACGHMHVHVLGHMLF